MNNIQSQSSSKRPPRGAVLILSPAPAAGLMGAGGAMALHAAQGDSVTVLEVGSSSSGSQRDLKGARSQQDKAESRRAWQRIGVREVHFIDASPKASPGFDPNCDFNEEAQNAESQPIWLPLLGQAAARRIYLPWLGATDPEGWLACLTQSGVGSHLGAAAARAELVAYEVGQDLPNSQALDITAVGELKHAALLDYRSAALDTDLVGQAVRRGLGHGRSCARRQLESPRLAEVFSTIRKAELSERAA